MGVRRLFPRRLQGTCARKIPSRPDRVLPGEAYRPISAASSISEAPSRTNIRRFRSLFSTSRRANRHKFVDQNPNITFTFSFTKKCAAGQGIGCSYRASPGSPDAIRARLIEEKRSGIEPPAFQPSKKMPRKTSRPRPPRACTHGR